MNRASYTYTDGTTNLQTDGGTQTPVSTRSSTLTPTTSLNNENRGVLVIAAPLQPAQRRQSNISFERHDLSLFEDLSREIDDDDCSSTDDSTVESSTSHEGDAEEYPGMMGIFRVGHTGHEDLQQQQEENNTEQTDDVHLNREIRTLHRSSFHRRTSEISMDLEDIREAVSELEGEEEDEYTGTQGVQNQTDEDNEGPNNQSTFGHSSPTLFSAQSRSSRRSRMSSATSVISRMEEEILAKAIENGKIVVSNTAEEDGFPSTHREGRRRSHDDGRRSSHSSSLLSVGGSRRVSFARPDNSSAFFGVSNGGNSKTGSVQDDIMTALQELRTSSGQDDIMAALEGLRDQECINDTNEKDIPIDGNKGNDHTESNDDLLVSKPQGKREDTGGKLAAIETLEGTNKALSAKVIELSSPLPHGARPRRSSFRKREYH